MLREGQQIGRYKILSLIGSGGMGEVFLAEDEKLERKVALKILSTDLAGDAERMRRFVQEAKAASALNHPNILTIHEIGESDAAHYIATEYIEGETLRSRMKHEKLSLPDALEIAIQTASALSAAHAAGIIHRDIKPENIMLRSDGYVKVLDFGLVKLIEQKTETDSEAETIAKRADTDPGRVMGTAGYMSPEQARGLAVDARTDIFSLGVVLYEMIAGRTPFEGETTLDVLSAILHREPELLAGRRADVPRELEHIVSKALRKDREERYQTIKDLLIDLKDLKRELALEADLERSISPNLRSRATTQSGGETATITQTATKRTDAEATSQQTTSSAEYIISEIKTHRRGVGLALAVLLVAAIGAGFWFFSNRTWSLSGASQIDSIAVLPFQNRSSDSDTEYLSDGLTESLIYRLSHLPNLKVSPTSSTFRYKGKETDPVKVGNELGVSAVLSGRILQRGDNLTISVELIDVHSNKLLWGEQYDRKLSDLLATQRDIAREIAERLKVKVTGEDQRGITKNYTNNNEAYQLYLKGRYHWNKREKEHLERGIQYFQQTINLDPNFALAYVGLSDTYTVLPSYPYLSPKEAFPRAKAAAGRALEIDPTLAEAHNALANVLAIYEWNWAEAEREFKRALELNPNSANTHYNYAYNYLVPMGRLDEAITEMKRALELEPLSLIINTNLGAIYIWTRKYDLALEQTRKANALEPNFRGGQFRLIEALTAKGMYDEAIALSQKLLQTDSESQHLFYRLGYAYARAGKRREAEEVLGKLKDLSKREYVMNTRIARIYAALGEREMVFALLERAFEARDIELPRLQVDAAYDLLRDDPRFQELIRRVGLTQ